MTLKEYAVKLGLKYGVVVNPDDVKEATTAYEYVKSFLPNWAVIQWLRDSNEQIKGYRQKFDMKPYDKFEAETLAEIEKLQREQMEK